MNNERKPQAAEPMLLHYSHMEKYAAIFAQNQTSPQAAENIESSLAPSYGKIDNIAVVDIQGLIVPSVPAWFTQAGIIATGMDQLAVDIYSATEDNEVKAIMLNVDSPGGYTGGVETASEAINIAETRKPLVAHIDGYCASAAYWLASQAGIIAATRTSTIGSIGTYIMVDDWSRMYENFGISTHVIASAENKTYGDKLSERPTDRQLGDAERIVTQLTEIFIETVARGRKVDVATVRAWATGEVWLGDEAEKKGLIDRTANFMEVVHLLQNTKGIGNE